VGTNRSGWDIKKGDWRVNMVEIFCEYVCKWKMRFIETIQE
jgi:hypothetical protein